MQLNNHLYWNDNSRADEQILQKAKKERIIKAQNKYSNFERNFYMRFPRKYLQKIARLAKINHIELNFLYIPEYGSPHPLPSEYETYKKYGKVWIPPVNIFEKPANWIDDGHLNIAGSNELSMWLATEILN